MRPPLTEIGSEAPITQIWGPGPGSCRVSKSGRISGSYRTAANYRLSKKSPKMGRIGICLKSMKRNLEINPGQADRGVPVSGLAQLSFRMIHSVASSIRQSKYLFHDKSPLS